MKKILFILIGIFFLTGCSNTFTYEFKENTITSSIELEFNDNEYLNYQEKFGEEYSDEVTSNIKSLIEGTYKNASAIAYSKDEKYFYYNATNYERNSNDNKFTYYYDFNYENFKLNYYLNDCFEHFTSTEDKNFYYYQISGAYTCKNENEFIFQIKENNRLAKSNSINIQNNIHAWKIRKNENDIYFVISKNELKENKISKFTLIAFMIITLLTISTFLLYNKLNRD